VCDDECGAAANPTASDTYSAWWPPKTDIDHGLFGNDWHSAHPIPKPHDADHCMICQMVGAPAVAASPVIISLSIGAVAAMSLLPVVCPPLRPAHALPVSCGPPV